MEPYFYENQQPNQPDRAEQLRKTAEEYLQAEQQYQAVVAEYRAATGDQRPELAATMQSLNFKLQLLRNSAGLVVGGHHGQEILNQIVLFDPAIHQSCAVHGDVQPGDSIRFMNTALCSPDGTVLIPAQAVPVY